MSYAIKGKKRCWKCNKVFPVKKFYTNKNKKDGFSDECKECASKMSKERYKVKYKDGNFDLDFRYSHYRACAKRRGLKFKLTKKEFKELTNQKCFLCGKYSSEYGYSGIDRIDNNVGYVLGNCIASCGKCNRLKYQYSIEETYKHLRDIYEYQKSIEGKLWQ